MSNKGLKSRTFWLVAFICLAACWFLEREALPAPLWVTVEMGALAQWLGGKYVAEKNGNGVTS